MKKYDVKTDNPIDFFNAEVEWPQFWAMMKRVYKNKIDDPFECLSEKEAGFKNSQYKYFKKITNGFSCVDLPKNINDFSDENFVYSASKFTYFQALQIYRFYGSFEDCLFFIRREFIKEPMNYIRVGTDFFKVLYKKNRYGVKIKTLKNWKKDQLKDDFGKSIIKKIPAFDDFTIEPNNTNFQHSIDGMYNLYSEFPHQPKDCKDLKKIPHISGLLNHIFNEQVEMGLKYLKVLYEYPKQILPVLVLTSRERQTGKTTFLNLLQMIFGENYVNVSPEEITSTFNHIYAKKNVIGIDETMIEKQSSVEKLKSISTQKTITVNDKYISQYTVPFYGKIVIATNRETDFMRIDKEEIRFWVRHVPSIKEINSGIENDMMKEIPMLLGYLRNMDDIDFSKSRMVFTQEEIKTSQLEIVKEESKSSLRKEIEIFMYEFFASNSLKYCYATPSDIKNEYFKSNNVISVNYIAKILKTEMELTVVDKTTRYCPFYDDGHVDPISKKSGKPFKFMRQDFCDTEQENFNNSNDIFEGDEVGF